MSWEERGLKETALEAGTELMHMEEDEVIQRSCLCSVWNNSVQCAAEPASDGPSSHPLLNSSFYLNVITFS